MCLIFCSYLSRVADTVDSAQWKTWMERLGAEWFGKDFFYEVRRTRLREKVEVYQVTRFISTALYEEELGTAKG